MRVISPDEIQKNKTAESCWMVRRGRVYDVTKFVNNHPGGAQLILDFAGNDITLLMNASDPHIHSKNAYKTLADMQIGVLEGHENDPGIDSDSAEPVDWSKPMLSQVGKLGSSYNTWVHTPVDRWVRLFHNDLIEMVSKSPWYLVPIIWTPVIIYNLFKSYHLLLMHPKQMFLGFGVVMHPWMVPLLFAGGCLSWPFIEYFLHRFVFHLEPSGDSQSFIRIHFTMHGLHHKAPFDPYHLVFPPLPASFVAVAIYSFYYTLLPSTWLSGWFAGTVLGYIVYDLTHYYLHHGHPEPNTFYGRLKKWHIRHHYIDPDNGFGVSSHFLDYPFGTAYPHYKYK